MAQARPLCRHVSRRCGWPMSKKSPCFTPGLPTTERIARRHHEHYVAPVQSGVAYAVLEIKQDTLEPRRRAVTTAPERPRLVCTLRHKTRRRGLQRRVPDQAALRQRLVLGSPRRRTWWPQALQARLQPPALRSPNDNTLDGRSMTAPREGDKRACAVTRRRGSFSA